MEIGSLPCVRREAGLTSPRLPPNVCFASRDQEIANVAASDRMAGPRSTVRVKADSAGRIPGKRIPVLGAKVTAQWPHTEDNLQKPRLETKAEVQD